MSIYNKKITIQNHPLTYEKKISINKGCRDGIYAGHGAGNMQIENLINKSTDTKNTDTKTINDMTAGMRVSDYIKTDSSDNMSKKAAVVGSSNSVDMSDTIYARPQAKNEAGNNNGTDMAENLLNDMNQTSENRRNDMIVTASTTTSDDYKAAKDDGYDVIVTETDKIKAVLAKAGVDISIYGDDLSMEQLTDITGSQTEAAMLVNQMKAYDIPATDDNIKAGSDSLAGKAYMNICRRIMGEEHNLDELLVMAESGRYSTNRINSCIGRKHKLDYVYPIENTECLCEINTVICNNLLQMLGKEMHYDCIVLNMGTRFKGFFDILDRCSDIYLVQKKGGISQWREYEFTEELIERGLSNVVERIKLIEPPVITTPVSTCDKLVELWKWNEFGDVIRNMTRGISCAG